MNSNTDPFLSKPCPKCGRTLVPFESGNLLMCPSTFCTYAEAAYDSRDETCKHIHRVAELLSQVSQALIERASEHDKSKLAEPEKPLFDKMTPKLKRLTYGSSEYKNCLNDLKPALDHHYAHNSHHPEHYPNGVNGMDLLDVIEMLVDWKAAGERHADGSITNSLRVNETRFKLEPQLVSILSNTVRNLGWS